MSPDKHLIGKCTKFHKLNNTSLAKICQTNHFTFYKQLFIQSDLQESYVHYKNIDFFYLLKDAVIMNKS